MLKVGAEVPIQVTPLCPSRTPQRPPASRAPEPAGTASTTATRHTHTHTHLVAKPAKCTPSAPAAVAGAQKVCKLKEATVRSPAHELQKASRGGLRSVRINSAEKCGRKPATLNMQAQLRQQNIGSLPKSTDTHHVYICVQASLLAAKSPQIERAMQTEAQTTS